MDVIKLIKDDHRKVEELFAQFEKLGDRAQKSKMRIVEQIIQELKLHAHLEETLFYPQAREAVKDEDVVLEGYEEHETLKFVIRELEECQAGDERFEVRVKVLKELVEHHVEEEEKEMLPEARKALGKERLREIAERWSAAKAAGLPAPNLRVSMVRELPVREHAADRIEPR